jgi:thiamine-phosphate pyrophosphorylase
MAEKPCGLIAMIPPALEAEWAARLEELIKPFKPAALIIQAPQTAAPACLIEKAKPLALAVLFADAAEAAHKTGASGVYFSLDAANISDARRTLGGESIIGAACGLSRHAAMESAEAGADFIAFDASAPENLDEAAELSSWWDEITGVPAALFFGKSRPDPSYLEKAHPDFLILEEAGRAGESLTFATEFGLQSQS